MRAYVADVIVTGERETIAFHFIGNYSSEIVYTGDMLP